MAKWLMYVHVGFKQFWVISKVLSIEGRSRLVDMDLWRWLLSDLSRHNMDIGLGSDYHDIIMVLIDNWSRNHQPQEQEN